MKKTALYILTALTLIVVPGAAAAQRASHAVVDGQVYRLHYPRSSVIDWKLDQSGAKRYVIGVRPFQLFNFGLKMNFEYEFGRPGNWLQFELTGHWTPWFSEESRESYRDRLFFDSDGGGWSGFISGFETFRKLSGVGVSVGYKYMISNNGWYINPVVGFKYFDVHYDDWDYLPFEEDGFTFYQYGRLVNNTKYAKPTVSFNIGKHFALSRSVFIDGFVGLGYTRSFNNYDDNRSYSDYYRSSYHTAHWISFGYRGLYFSGGLRLSFMWRK